MRIASQTEGEFEKLAAPSTTNHQRHRRPYVPASEYTPTSRSGTFALIRQSLCEQKNREQRRSIEFPVMQLETVRKEREGGVHIQDVTSLFSSDLNVNSKKKNKIFVNY